MHAIFFGVKRVHIEAVRLTGHIIRMSALTPARFDLMRLVQLHPDGLHQSVVPWLLGVTAPVVSRMLKALQKLGFVEREKDQADGRCLIIRITERGKVAVGMAKQETLVNREAERTAARVVTADRRLVSKTPQEREEIIAGARRELATFDSLLLSIRHALFDRAPYHHPWQVPPFADLVPFDRVAAACMHVVDAPRSAGPSPSLYS
jgi:DNA-binding MarR family transcriptional regulator